MPAAVLRRAQGPSRLASVIIVLAAAAGALYLSEQGLSFRSHPFAFIGAPARLEAHPSAVAFGASGEVQLRFALPGASVRYPLDVHGDPSSLSYSWVRVGDSIAVTALVPLLGATVSAPMRPGFYRLILSQGTARRVLDEITLAVLVPFERKEEGMLNGYAIGTYLAERLSGRQAPPDGFLEITPADVNLRISKHLRIADFLSHDDQQTWPRYVAISPRLLDKLELVMMELARWHGADGPAELALDVHSGFRTPAHNRRVRRAATDSQHQYGDAADVVIDANGDGRFSAVDSRLVGLAVEIVEMKHPHLAGGLGLYTHSRSHGAYVHIDARGIRARWRG